MTVLHALLYIFMQSLYLSLLVCEHVHVFASAFDTDLGMWL